FRRPRVLLWSSDRDTSEQPWRTQSALPNGGPALNTVCSKINILSSLNKFRSRRRHQSVCADHVRVASANQTRGRSRWSIVRCLPYAGNCFGLDFFFCCLLPAALPNELTSDHRST